VKSESYGHYGLSSDVGKPHLCTAIWALTIWALGHLGARHLNAMLHHWHVIEINLHIVGS